MLKLLISIFIINFNLSASDLGIKNDASRLINKANSKVKVVKEFKNKILIIEKLKDNLQTLDISISKEQVQNNKKEYHYLSSAITVLELIDFKKLSLKNCKENLNTIHIAFDPQISEKPRLLSPVKDIYNMIAFSCGSTALN